MVTGLSYNLGHQGANSFPVRIVVEYSNKACYRPKCRIVVTSRSQESFVSFR